MNTGSALNDGLKIVTVCTSASALEHLCLNRLQTQRSWLCQGRCLLSDVQVEMVRAEEELHTLMTVILSF